MSNAFEGRFDTPLLGMQRYVQQLAGQPRPDADAAKAFAGAVGGRPALVVAGAGPREVSLKDCNQGISRSDTHGGFDNDEATLNSVLWRVLGSKPKRPFTMRDLQY